MKRSRWTAAISLLLVAATVLSGCGKKGEEKTGTSAVASKEHVYKAENLEFKGIETDNINHVFYKEDKIVLIGNRWETIENPQGSEGAEGVGGTEGAEGTEAPEGTGESEETPAPQPRSETEDTEETTDSTETTEAETSDDSDEAAADEAVEEVAVASGNVRGGMAFSASSSTAVMYEEGVEDMDGSISVQKEFIAVYDYEGNQLSYNEKQFAENEWTGQYAMSGSEDALYCTFETYFEDNSDPENYVWEQNSFLVKKSLDGTEEWRIPLSDYAEEGTNVYVRSIVADKEGRLCVFLDMGKVLLFASDSGLVKQFTISEEDTGSVMMSDTGKLMILFWGEGSQYIKTLDLDTEQLSESYKVPGNSYNYSYYGGTGYDLFLSDATALYGYNLGEETMTEIMNFIDSDLDTSNVYNIYGTDASTLYGSYYSYTEEKSCYAKFTKVAPEDVVEKKVISLGCIYMDYEVRKQVVNFNKTNGTYRIHIKDYSTYNTEEDYTQAYTKLNTDIVSGNVPDIIMLNSSLPIDSYIAKGLFEDLNPFIDADEEMDRSDFMTNVMETFSTDGKLYQLVPSFMVLSVAGKTADVGSASGWTLDELNALAAQKGEGTEIFFDVIQESILQYCMQMSSEQFINWETGECNFDTEGFAKLLEFAKQFPKEYDQSRYNDDSFWQSYDSLYRDGRALLSITYLDSFSSYNMMEKGTFGEEITLIGFPADNKKGSAINANMSMAMYSKSANKDGAWEFMRHFLTYDYQKNVYGFPVNLQRYEELKKEAMQKPYYMDENNKKVEYDQTYYVGDLEIIIPPMTEEEIQKVEDFIFSLDQPVSYNEDLNKIIMEESASYFEGQKSAQEVAAIIQSRVSIYVNENR